MSRRKRSKLEHIEGDPRVMKFKPSRDERGRYLPYCDFGYHQGFPRNPEVCRERRCEHYYEIRITTERDYDI